MATKPTKITASTDAKPSRNTETLFGFDDEDNRSAAWEKYDYMTFDDPTMPWGQAISGQFHRLAQAICNEKTRLPNFDASGGQADFISMPMVEWTWHFESVEIGKDSVRTRMVPYSVEFAVNRTINFSDTLKSWTDLGLTRGSDMKLKGLLSFDAINKFKGKDISEPIAPKGDDLKKTLQGVAFDVIIEYSNAVGTQVIVKVQVTPVITVPLEYALLATNAMSLSEFSRHSWSKWFPYFFTYQWATAANRKKLGYVRDSIISELSFERHLKNIKTDYGLKSSPRVSEDGYTVLRTGRILWIPPVSEGAFTSWAKTANDLYDPNAPLFNKAESVSSISNKALKIDWELDQLIYSSTTGTTLTTRLTGSKPLKPYNIARLFRENMWSNCMGFFSQSVTGMHRLAGQPDIFSVGIFTNVSWNNKKAWMDIIPEDMTWQDLFNGEYVDRDGSKDLDINKAIVALRNMLVSYYKTWSTQGKSKVSVTSQIQWSYLWDLIGKWSPDMKKFMDEEKLAITSNTRKRERTDKPTLYGLPGVNVLLPHQTSLNDDMQNPAPATVLGVRPGGGKALIQISRSTAALSLGLAKRPCIAVPGAGLVKQMLNEINTFSKGTLRPFVITLRKIRQWQDLGFDWNKMRDMVFAQPKGTIFVLDSNMFRYEADELGVNINWEPVYPLAKWIETLEFDYFQIDESTTTKNIGSSVSEAASTAVGTTKYITLSSGTFVHNTVRDVLGQLAIVDPGVFGDNLEEYQDEYGKMRPEKLALFNKNLNAAVRKIDIPTREWNFILPTPREYMYVPQMTQNQTKFYNKVMDDVLQEIKADKTLMRLMKSGDPNVEDKIAGALSRYFGRLETFLGAPDTDMGRNYGTLFKDQDGITQKDLISPKLAMIDRILDVEFNGGTFPESKVTHKPTGNKVLVISTVKAISDHFMRNTRHNKKMLHYKAGDYDVIEQAMNDPNVGGVFADATTIMMGFNFQAFDSVIVAQSPWVPGDYEQILARALRPDVPDEKGNQKYNREEVRLHWIVTDKTIDITKACRLMLKFIEVAKVDEGDTNPSFKAWLKDNEALVAKLSFIPMNLDTIRDLNDFDVLVDYAQSYSSFRNWQIGENKKELETLRKAVEAKEGRKLSDKEFKLRALVKPTHKPVPTPPVKYGEGYIPFFPGVNPPDTLKLGLQALSEIVDEEDENSEATEIETASVTVGDVVVTEYGVGLIEAARSGASTVTVQFKGRPSVKLSRTVVYIPSTIDNQKRLKSWFSRARDTTVLDKDGSHKTITIDLSSTRIDDKGIPSDAKPRQAAPSDKSENLAFEDKVYTTIMNGKPVLWIDLPKQSTRDQLTAKGWIEVNTHAAIELTDYKKYQIALNWLRSNWSIPRKNLDMLKAYSDLWFKHKKPKSIPGTAYQAMMKLVKENAKPIDDKTVLLPYLYFEEGDNVVIAINGKTCPAARKLPGKLIPGAGRWYQEDGWMIKFYDTKGDIVKDLKALEKIGFVPKNSKTLQRDINKL